MGQKVKAMMVNNGIINVPDVYIDYRGYKIVPKMDFGGKSWLINGNTIQRGYIVVRGGINIMPGATWFTSVIEAKAGIDCLIESGKTNRGFWELFREKQGLDEWEEV